MHYSISTTIPGQMRSRISMIGCCLLVNFQSSNIITQLQALESFIRQGVENYGISKPDFWH